MEDQYGMADLRQLMTNGSSSSIPHFPAIPLQHQHQDLLFSGVHRNLTHSSHLHNYEMMMLSGAGHHHQVSLEMLPRGHGSLHHEFHTNSLTTATPTTTTSTGGVCAGAGASSGTPSGLESTDVGCIGGDGGTGRWPRQETLSLLEIRSRLDHKFKEANQKGPLWDEVSRILSDEHGYQRSGKKCREKFENLYKYYKKTKEGKAGRQDGKHYRFFRQLEALYGPETTTNNIPVSLSEPHLIGHNLPFHSAINNNSSFHQANDTNQEAFQTPKLCDSLSLSNSSEFDTSSSDGSVEKSKRRRGGSRRNWKVKIKDFIDSQMRKLMEKQEAWLEKMTRTIEHKEQERVYREEEWRKQEAARLDREHKFWANERAWIEARDAALMEAMHKLTGKEINNKPDDHQLLPNDNANENDISSSSGGESWPESEITRLIQLRISMESRFQNIECSEEVVLWEEIAAKMGCFGYDHRRSAIMCKDKWDTINNYLKKTKDCEFSLYNQGLIGERGPEMLSLLHQPNNDGSSSSPSNSNAVQEGGFPFFMGDGDDHQNNLWENYGVTKLNNEGRN